MPYSACFNTGTWLTAHLQGFSLEIEHEFYGLRLVFQLENKYEVKLKQLQVQSKFEVEREPQNVRWLRDLPKVFRNLNGLCIFDSLSFNKWTLLISNPRLSLIVGPILAICKKLAQNVASNLLWSKQAGTEEFKWQLTIDAKFKSPEIAEVRSTRLEV